MPSIWPAAEQGRDTRKEPNAGWRSPRTAARILLDHVEADSRIYACFRSRVSRKIGMPEILFRPFGAYTFS